MNKRWRLDSKSPTLAEAFRKAGPEHQRRATRLACETVVPVVGIADDVNVKAALRALRERGTGDSALRASMTDLSARFDDEYLRLSEESDETRKAEALALFAKARGASALAFALTDDASQLHEAIYEAISALFDDPTELARSVESVLRASVPGC